MNQHYWRRTKGLMFFILALWFIFSFAIHLFVEILNKVQFLGFPLGFYLAAQGSLIVFVIIIFYYVRKQNKIDHECGVNE